MPVSAPACWPDQKPRPPEPLRAELRPLTQSTAPGAASQRRGRKSRQDPELRGALLALLSVARRIKQLIVEERELAREIKTLTENARTTAARPARRRTAPRGPSRALLVPQRPVRSEAAFAGSPAPPRSPPHPDKRSATASAERRPTTQPSPAPDPRHPQTHAPRHDRLHRTPHQRRQNTPRSKPLPQTLPRPQPLPAPREWSGGGRVDKHRSITGPDDGHAHSKGLCSLGRRLMGPG